MKRIKISFIDEKVEAVAVLLEDKAPETCKCIWNVLEKPFENYAVHAMWTGRELSLGIPAEKFPNDEGLNIPPENQTVIPIPGDLIWNAYFPYQWQGNPKPVYDFGIFYGRESRLLLPVGWRPSNRFGEIVENLSKFAEVAARCQIEGRKRLRVERLEK
ncbi:MAG: hypothetical protein DRP87_08655 [Spirochaetes bacterium]|nr:MAG: hypothetical protein DRP87_08655 [Spirochaetota bacterium]